MLSTFSLSDLLLAHAAEDAALDAGDRPLFLVRERERIHCFETLQEAKPRDVAEAIEALIFLQFILSEGPNLEAEDAARVKPLVDGAFVELKANGRTLRFIRAMRLAIQAAPSDNEPVSDYTVNTVLRNVMEWAVTPTVVSA